MVELRGWRKGLWTAWLVMIALALLGRPAAAGSIGTINDSVRHSLPGNIRPELAGAVDAGAVADDTQMDHILLVLTGSAEQRAAAKTYVESLTNRTSSNFHRWLTAAQYGASYGPSDEDLQKITDWLTSQGFAVNHVSASRAVIDFSGTAQSVKRAFGTEIHAYSAGGKTHVANASNPSIPAAMSGVVSGIASLHDFTPRPKRRSRAQYTVTSGTATEDLVVPGDLATIYSLKALFSAGYSGAGETIAVIEDSDLYSTSDWTTFRSTFGLSSYTSGSLTTLHPGTGCSAPGVVSGDAEEAALDVEWASAAAPNATIELVSCASTNSSFGGMIALNNLLETSAPPPVVSISYGECEAANGASANAAWNTLMQLAASEGVSVFVAAGDEGAAGCDADADGATHGVGVNAFASSPYDVAVGGTDFADTMNGTASTYWSTTNATYYASARSYIPEIPWDDSCASSLIASYLGYSTSYGSSGFCASSKARSYDLVSVAAGSGGPSGCAIGTPSTLEVVGGTCVGYGKPSWQSVTGVPSDGVRDLPDVSLFAATGIWGHAYVFCYSNLKDSGAACSGKPANWSAGGGTSFAAPIMAGIQALVDQKQGSRQGNPNPVYYKLAALSGVWCTSSSGDSGSCIFHNVTTGGIDVDCSGSVDCYGATSSSTSRTVGGSQAGGRGFGQTTGTSSYTGVLSTLSSSFSAAYAAGSGWNFATGLGSVNAYNLVMKWSSGL